MAWEVSFLDPSIWCFLDCIWLGIFFHRLGKFSSVVFLKILSMSLEWDYSPSMFIIYKVSLFTVSQRSFMFGSWSTLSSSLMVCPHMILSVDKVFIGLYFFIYTFFIFLQYISIFIEFYFHSLNWLPLSSSYLYFLGIHSGDYSYHFLIHTSIY